MKTASLIAGLGAVALYLLCFQLKEAKRIIACKLLSSILYVVQYLLLFAFVGAAMDASSFVISTLAYKKDSPIVHRLRVPIWILSFGGIVLLGALLYDGPISLLAIAGVIFESIANWMRREKMIRIVSLFSVPCWLVYNAVSGAYGAVVGSVLALFSIIIALVRYSKQEERHCDPQ